MLIWITTIIFLLIAVFGWFFIKRDTDRYLHGEKAPMNFFFKWGHSFHHFFKIAIIVFFMIAIFSFYKYLLAASYAFSLISSVIAGIIISGGKELLDKLITLDDVIVSILGIIIGFLAIILFF